MTEEVCTGQGQVGQRSPRVETEGVHADIKLNRRGELCICDWYTQMALEGRVFQVKAGTITTPLIGDILITDTKAEMACEAPLGMTMIPVYAHIATRDGISASDGTLHEYAAKSVGLAVTTHGTAFIPLPLKMGGVASHCVASTGQTGGVVVAAEGPTTTRCHWHVANPVAMGAGHETTSFMWQPRVPPVCAGIATFYIQVAAATHGPDYYASFDFIELPTVNVK